MVVVVVDVVRGCHSACFGVVVVFSVADVVVVSVVDAVVVSVADVVGVSVVDVVMVGVALEFVHSHLLSCSSGGISQ